MSDTATARTYDAEHFWQGGGWSADAKLTVDRVGHISASGGTVSERLRGWVLPGMPNLHSHAFQRAMAGLTERSGSASATSSFWTWRETMYAFASRINPEQLQAIAAQLYVEMLKSGYTHVCEFHYLHHQPDGTPYADPTAMSQALIEAAREAGIGLTLLPVLYMRGGFDGRPLSERQRRFGLEVDAYLRLIEQLRTQENPMLRIGIALHSLRAVPPDAMHAVLDGIAQMQLPFPPPPGEGGPQDRERVRPERAAASSSPTANPAMPIHTHIAEQLGEVQDCLALRNARPVEWLLDHADVDAQWCLIHATHMTDDETRRLAATGAIAGLCPTTEANLGDGLFPLASWLEAGGELGIGSDSHISVSPVEELRWLEYGQRLTTHHRNIASSNACASVGETLWPAALAGGARAAGMPIGQMTPGHRADCLVLDAEAPLLAARDASNVIDSFIFAGNTPLVRDVMVGGQWVVRDFVHHDEQRIAMRYRATVEALSSP